MVFICQLIAIRLKTEIYPQKESPWSGIEIVVDPVEYFRIQAFVFCDRTHVLQNGVESQVYSFMPEFFEIIAQSDVVQFHKRGVLYIVVGEILGVPEVCLRYAGRDIAVESGIVVHAGIDGSVGLYVVVDIVAEAATAGNIQVPVFISQVRGETGQPFRSGAFVAVEIELVDKAVVVEIGIYAFDRFPVLSVYLAVDIKSIGFVPFAVNLNRASRSAGDSSGEDAYIIRVFIPDQSDNFIFVIG